MRCKKKIYRDKKEARKARKRLNRNKVTKRKITNIYYCSECDSYHLTSMDKEHSRSITRKEKDN